MKECNKIQPMLSEYIDGVLPEADSSRVRSHLEECTGCMEMYKSMREIIVYINDMDEVDPPEGFLDRVNKRLENESSFGRIIRGIFHPLHIKVPIEIAGLAAAVVLLVYISGFVGKQGIEDILPAGTGNEVAENLDGVEPVENRKAQDVVRSSDRLDESDGEKDLESSGPEIAGTTEEILVEAPLKRIEVKDSDLSYRVTSDELQELPVDDVVEAIALKGGIVKTGDDLHVRGGSASTDMPDIDSSPDSIYAELVRALDLLGGRIVEGSIINEKKITPADDDSDATRVRSLRPLTAREFSTAKSSDVEPFAKNVSAQTDSLAVPIMNPVVALVPRSELERLYLAILKIGSVRPIEMEMIAEEGDSVRLRIEFP